MGKEIIKSGLKVNKITVIEPSGKSTRTGKYWNCVCECGKTLEVVAYQLNKNNKRCIKSCGCDRYTWIDKSSKDISGTYFSHMRNSAKYRKIEFKITIDYLQKLWDKQCGKCALSGKELTLIKGRKWNGQTGSVDRIDSSKGYVKGNLQWVYKDINFMKLKLSNEEFIKICSEVYNYNKND